MILILASNTDTQGAEYKQLTTFLASLEGINTRVHTERGTEKILTEIYLIGSPTAHSPANTFNVSCPKRTPLYSKYDGRGSSR